MSRSVAARVIADASGPFAHTVLSTPVARKGSPRVRRWSTNAVCLGRIIAAGERSARVLLLTDLNSRIPVMIEGDNLKAILVGDSSLRPVLEYLPPGSRLTDGARVVTTPDGGVFPPGVAVGRVATGSSGLRVQLFTGEGRADFVRVLHYVAPVDVDKAPPDTDPANGKAGAVSSNPASAPPPQASAPSVPAPNAAQRQPT